MKRGLRTSEDRIDLSIVDFKDIGASVPILVEFTTEEVTTELHKNWSPAAVADFKGSLNSTSFQYGSSGSPVARHLWIGLGKQASVDANTLRKVISKAVDKLAEAKLSDAVLTFDLDYLHSINSHLTQCHVISTVTTTLVLANYFFDRHFANESKKKKLSKVVIAVKQQKVDLKSLHSALDTGLILGEATNQARDLANERADICNPAWMESKARDMVELNQGLYKIEVLQFDELKKLGLNLFASVGQGASVLPRLVIISYRGDPENPNNEIALVGKGITFDTGGLNLKPTGSIEDMYLDMSGSAVVFGVLSALGKLGVKKNIVGALCMAENAISHNAYYPSAIIKSYKGLTVEIGNTDAEGRLVLADGLAYVQEHYKPAYVVDIATLTGACMIALGEYASGLFTNNNEIRDALITSGDAVFERTWPLPTFSEYSDEIRGAQSDLKNIGNGRYGGACTAAAFLKEFIDPNVKWAHMDIAGPGMTSTKRGHIPKGATGYGVQLLLEWIRNKK